MANSTEQIISNNLSGTNILFRSESIEGGLFQLSVLTK